MKKLLSLLIACTMFAGCGSRSRTDADVSDVKAVPVKIHRYDLALFSLDTVNLVQGLQGLRHEFPFFLDTDLGDPAKSADMRRYLENERNLKVYHAVKEKYPSLEGLEKDLTGAFRHYQFYYPNRKAPRVYAYISGCDYENPAGMADSVLLVALDDFLGAKYPLYESDGLPLYRVHRMEAENILPAAMTALYFGTAPQSVPGYSLLEQMVDAGKRLWFIDAMIPDYPNHLKIGYTKDQWTWVEKYSSQVWAAIIENQLLYTPSGQAMKTFLADGPFTAEFSRESPPRLGEYIGWQIIRQYMENNPSVTLEQLLQEKDAQKILTLSRYKPKK